MEHTGVIDQDVNAPERGEGCVDDALCFDIASQIADRNCGAATRSSDFVSHAAPTTVIKGF
jgi:hypothetical protein